MVLAELVRQEISLDYISDILLRRQPEKNVNSVYAKFLSANYEFTVCSVSYHRFILLFEELFITFYGLASDTLLVIVTCFKYHFHPTE